MHRQKIEDSVRHAVGLYLDAFGVENVEPLLLLVARAMDEHKDREGRVKVHGLGLRDRRTVC